MLLIMIAEKIIALIQKIFSLIGFKDINLILSQKKVNFIILIWLSKSRLPPKMKAFIIK